MAQSLTAKIEGNELVIRLPLEAKDGDGKYRQSSTGKTRTVATTHGFQYVEGLSVEGQPLKVSINAFIK